MYFDFEDYHPDIYPVGRALTRLEVILLSIIFHLVMVIVILVSPKYFPALFASPPAMGQLARNQPQPDSPESQSTLQLSTQKPSAAPNGANGRASSAGGSLGDALRNLQRYVQNEQFDNQGGGGGQFGPEIQFDTKGVEFGPWIRRFIAQVKRNWFIPYAAMSMKGHVVITFNVHKEGAITDLSVVGPCPVDAFNNAAFGALSSSNPTQPLPPEYPSE